MRFKMVAVMDVLVFNNKVYKVGDIVSVVFGKDRRMTEGRISKIEPLVITIDVSDKYHADYIKVSNGEILGIEMVSGKETEVSWMPKSAYCDIYPIGRTFL